MKQGQCLGCAEHRYTLIGGFCDLCRVSGEPEYHRMRDALESLDVILADDDGGLPMLVQARMTIEKALGIHERRTEERRALARKEG